MPGSGWELCVGEGGCVGTRMLRERPWLNHEEEDVWGSAPVLGALAGERRLLFFYRSLCAVETGNVWWRCASAWGFCAALLPWIWLQLWKL